MFHVFVKRLPQYITRNLTRGPSRRSRRHMVTLCRRARLLNSSCRVVMPPAKHCQRTSLLLGVRYCVPVSACRVWSDGSMKQSLRRRDRRSIEWRLWREKLCSFLCDYYCSMPLQLLERKCTLKRKYGHSVVSPRCCLFSHLIYVRECLLAIMTSALDVQHAPLAVGPAHGHANARPKGNAFIRTMRGTPRNRRRAENTLVRASPHRPPLPYLIFLLTRLFVFLRRARWRMPSVIVWLTLKETLHITEDSGLGETQKWGNLEKMA